MKKLIISLGIVIFVIFALIIVVPSFIDWEGYKKQARQALVEKTGYDVIISGDIGLDILPSPRLAVGDVTVFKPEFQDKPLLKLGRAEVLVNPLSLLSGEVQISSIVLADGQVLLHKNAQDKDNWSVTAKNQDTQPPADAQAEQGQSGSGVANITISRIYLENIGITYEDTGAESIQSAMLETARLKMDSLQGPYDADMRISHQGQKWDVTLQSDGYSDIAGLPLTLTIEDRQDAAKLSYAGVVEMAEALSVQGEIDLNIKDFAGFQNALTGQDIRSGQAGFIKNMHIKGMVSADPARVKLNDGVFNFNGSKAAMTLELSGIGSDVMTVASTISFEKVVNLDEYKNLFAFKGSGNGGSGLRKAGSVASAPQKALLPQNVALPANLQGNLNISVPGVIYNGKQTGQIVLGATYEKGVLQGDLNAFSLPEKTDFKASAKMGFTAKEAVADDSALVVYKQPQLEARINAETQNLQGVLVDWMGVADAGSIPPEMPRYVGMDITIMADSNALRLQLTDVDLGQTAVSGFVSYNTQNGGQPDGFATPLIQADIKSGNLVLPDFIANSSNNGGTASSGGSAAVGQQQAQNMIASWADNLPYDLDMQLSMERLALGERVFKGLTANFVKKGQMLNIEKLAVQDHINTAFDIAGRINDIRALSGIDILLKVNSSEIDSLLSAYNIQVPASLPQPVGAISTNLRLQGDLAKAGFTLNANAYGFALSANGTKDNLLQPEMPQSVNVTLNHNNSEQAIRFLRPEYRSKSALMDRPFKLSATLTNRPQQSEIKDMQLNIGPSSITGNALISNGSVPHIKASVQADNLPIRVLAGGAEAMTAAGTAAQTGQPTRNAGETPWSRDAIDTAALRAVNADLMISAQKLSYGHSVVRDAVLNASLTGGVLNISKLSGKLDEGQIDGRLKLNASAAKQPLNIDGRFAVTNASVAAVSKALVGRAAEKLGGRMAMNADFTASGVSSAALISALNGTGSVQIIDPVLRGIDIRAMYNTLRNLDSFEGAILGFLQSTTGSGSTQFNSVDKQFRIVNGVVPIDNWAVKTDNAVMLSNGKIDFPNWNIDLDNTIQIEGVKNLPSFGMRIYGPLDAPETLVTRQTLESYMRSRLGDKVRDVITDKVISDDVQNKVKDKLGVDIGDLLPLGQKREAQDNQNDAGGANDNQQQQQEQEDPAKQIFRGILQELAK